MEQEVIGSNSTCSIGVFLLRFANSSRFNRDGLGVEGKAVRKRKKTASALVFPRMVGAGVKCHVRDLKASVFVAGS